MRPVPVLSDYLVKLVIPASRAILKLAVIYQFVWLGILVIFWFLANISKSCLLFEVNGGRRGVLPGDLRDFSTSVSGKNVLHTLQCWWSRLKLWMVGSGMMKFKRAISDLLKYLYTRRAPWGSDQSHTDLYRPFPPFFFVHYFEIWRLARSYRAPPEAWNSSQRIFAMHAVLGGRTGRFNPRFQVLALFWTPPLSNPKNAFLEKSAE